MVLRTVRRLDAPGRVGLTFDDGPQPEALDGFLRALDQLGVRATFFLVGEQVRRARAAAGAIVDAGHEVACHGDHHVSHLRMTPRATVQDLLAARDAIEDATEAELRMFRPPYGIFNGASWVAAGRFGWSRVLWARWGRDWESRATPRGICDRVLSGVRGGDVILLHDSDRYSAPGSWRRTLAALRPLVDGLRERGLEPGSIGEVAEAGQGNVCSAPG